MRYTVPSKFPAKSNVRSANDGGGSGSPATGRPSPGFAHEILGGLTNGGVGKQVQPCAASVSGVTPSAWAGAAKALRTATAPAIVNGETIVLRRWRGPSSKKEEEVPDKRRRV